MKVVLTEPYYDLYSPTRDNVSVQITDVSNNAMLFRGYVIPNVYNQPYTKFYDTLELECAETVSNLKYLEYAPVNGVSKEIVSLKNVVDQCMKASDISVYHVADSYRVEDSLLDELHIDEANFFDDDPENSPWKLDEILKEICKFSGLTFYTEGTEGFFLDKEQLLYSDPVSFHKYVVDVSGYQTETPDIPVIDISINDWAATGTNLELDENYNQIKITANTYPIDEELPDIFENFQNLYIVNQWVPNDTGENSTPSQQVFIRVAPFESGNYTCRFFSPSKYLEFIPQTFGYFIVDESDAIQPTVPDSNHRNGEIDTAPPYPPYPGDDITDIGCKVLKAGSIDFIS